MICEHLLSAFLRSCLCFLSEQVCYAIKALADRFLGKDKVREEELIEYQSKFGIRTMSCAYFKP